MNKYVLLIFGLLLAFAIQAQDCSQNLVDAKRAYFNGRFQEVITLLSDCIDEFKRLDEKTESLELLCNAYLVTDKPEKADSLMLQLLKIRPQYKTRTTDLVEFKQLQESYEIKTRFNLSLFAGMNNPEFQVMQYRSIASETLEPGSYESNIGANVGIGFDWRLVDEFYISIAALYQRNSYSYTETILDYQDVSVIERLDFLNTPILLRYQLSYSDYQLILSAGMSAHWLLVSRGDIELFGRESGSRTILNGIPEKTIDYNLSEQRNKVNLNYVFGAAIRRKFGLTAIELVFNYEYGLNNLVIGEERFSNEDLYRTYSYIPDDFKMNQWRISVGIVQSFVYPKKKLK